MRILVLIFGLLWPLAGLADEVTRQIVVRGTGVVSAAPDMAIMRLGVTREARTASEAMETTSEATARVLESITAAGIEARDVQTSAINLSPVWDHSNARPPQLRGYLASNDLTVRIRDLEGLGGLLDAVVSEGANTLNGLSFSIDETGPLEAHARTDAVLDAQAKAETLAVAGGVTLGPVLQINEAGGGVTPAPMLRGAMMEAAPVPIAEGEVDIRISVTVVYGIAE